MFKDRLKELRKKARISQEELGAKVYVSKQAISKWEMNTATPNPEMIVKLAEIFGVSTDYLLEHDTQTSDLPADEQELLDAYRSLPDYGKQTLRNTVEIFRRAYANAPAQPQIKIAARDGQPVPAPSEDVISRLPDVSSDIDG